MRAGMANIVNNQNYAAPDIATTIKTMQDIMEGDRNRRNGLQRLHLSMLGLDNPDDDSRIGHEIRTWSNRLSSTALLMGMQALRLGSMPSAGEMMQRYFQNQARFVPYEHKQNPDDNDYFGKGVALELAHVETWGMNAAMQTLEATMREELNKGILQKGGFNMEEPAINTAISFGVAEVDNDGRPVAIVLAQKTPIWDISGGELPSDKKIEVVRRKLFAVTTKLLSKDEAAQLQDELYDHTIKIPVYASELTSSDELHPAVIALSGVYFARYRND